MKTRSHSLESTWHFVERHRLDAVDFGNHVAHAHWRNCQLALRYMMEPFRAETHPYKWGVPICIDWREA